MRDNASRCAWSSKSATSNSTKRSCSKMKAAHSLVNKRPWNGSNVSQRTFRAKAFSLTHPAHGGERPERAAFHCCLKAHRRANRPTNDVGLAKWMGVAVGWAVLIPWEPAGGRDLRGPLATSGDRPASRAFACAIPSIKLGEPATRHTRRSRATILQRQSRGARCQSGVARYVKFT